MQSCWLQPASTVHKALSYRGVQVNEQFEHCTTAESSWWVLLLDQHEHLDKLRWLSDGTDHTRWGKKPHRKKHHQTEHTTANTKCTTVTTQAVVVWILNYLNREHWKKPQGHTICWGTRYTPHGTVSRKWLAWCWKKWWIKNKFSSYITVFCSRCSDEGGGGTYVTVAVWLCLCLLSLKYCHGAVCQLSLFVGYVVVYYSNFNWKTSVLNMVTALSVENLLTIIDDKLVSWQHWKLIQLAGRWRSRFRQIFISRQVKQISL